MKCFMLVYYQIVTCLLVTCAAAFDVGLHVDATAYVLQLKILSVNHDKFSRSITSLNPLAVLGFRM